MNQSESALTPYRALDLTDKKGFLCGKILAELGADVIKIEPPGGDPSRRHGPFYQNIPHPERSLYWWAFNASKRGITLDIATPAGQDTFKKLAAATDFVIESFPPGYLDSIGLGYAALQKVNSAVVLVSITPYGQTGPYRDLKATDLTLEAMGGQMSVAGDSDRPPVRISVPQAYMHGGCNAAAACLIALHNRGKTGIGQHVDVSIHESVARALGAEVCYSYYGGQTCYRNGPCRPRAEILLRDIWPCKDGSVTIKVLGGPRLREIRPLVEWMIREGRGGPMQNTDWSNLGTFTRYGKDVEESNNAVAAFLREHTVAQVMDLALSARLPIMPNNSVAAVVSSEQLASRHYWVTAEHPDIGRSATYPGAPYLLSETPWRMRSVAPRIGQHNKEVFSELEAAQKPKELNRPVQTHTPDRTGKSLPSRALEGIKIADFTWVLTGPLTTKYLTTFGAEAIKIESSARPDNSRITQPYKDGIEGVNRSGPFQIFNAGKRSLSLNLSMPKGRELARKVVAWADVVAENFTPGTMAKWGLGYDDLKKIRPDIIMLSASIQGGTGPFNLHPGFGWNLSGLAGFNHLTGWPDRDPVSPAIAYTDWVAPVYGAIAILAAVDYRRRTGKGQHIDLSQFESGVTYLASAVLEYTLNGNSQMRRGNRSSSAAPHGAYPCLGHEQWCAIVVETEAEWQGLKQVMGGPAWSASPRFSSLMCRKENEDELDTLVAAWTAGLTAEEVMLRLQAAGVPSGIVQTNDDLVKKDPHLKHRRFFQYVEHPEAGTTLVPREPILMDSTPPEMRRAPCLGEDTEYFCREVLGISEAEFAGLKAEGVLK